MLATELEVGMVVKDPTPSIPWGVVLKKPPYGLAFGFPLFGPPGEVKCMSLTVDTIPPTQEIITTLRTTDSPFLLSSTGSSMCSGMDPEVFVTTEEGEVLPAFDFLPSKEKPIVAEVDYGQVAAFYDGFQAEYTLPGQTCHGFMTDYVRVGLQKVLEAARVKSPGAKLSIASALPISEEMMRQTDPKHIRLGCAPSRNAYAESPLGMPDASTLLYRFAGSHMHFGSMSLPKEQVVGVVKFLDATAGVAMVAMSEGFTDTTRRQYYGRAGEYRFHPGGPGECRDRLEYRVPDPLLIAHPATFNAVWDFTRVAFRMGKGGLGFLWDAGEDEVRRAINESDVKLARDILIRNQAVMRNMIRRANPLWGCDNTVWVPAMEKLFLGGIGEVVRDPTDVEGNWWLGKESTTPREKTEGVFGDEKWISESYGRAHKFWPYGRIWSSAAEFVAKGEKV